MGSLTAPSQLVRVSAHVDDAVAKGATVLTGGHPLPDVGPLAYAPTVLTDVTEDMALCREETFGPVVSVYRSPTPTRPPRGRTTPPTASTRASGVRHM